MSDETPAPPTADVEAPDDKKDKKARKKKKRVRSAWISFVGRILAQVIGATATVALGLLIADRLRTPHLAAPPAASPTPSATMPARPAGAPVSIAVLPLANLSGDPSQEYFADGMTEALITDLAQLPGLRVISRTSSMHYKGERRPLPEIARELDVDLVVEGSVARAGARVRVTAQLVDARRDQHLWAHTYDRTARDVFALQADIADAIGREVKGALSPEQQSRLAQRRPVDPGVYDVYLRGRHAWNRRTPEGYDQAIRFFDQAIRDDPDFALAYAGLADTYSLLGTLAADRQETAAKAKAAAERAIALDDGLAEAHTSLAAVYHREEGRRTDADREFRRALSLNPGYTTGHQWYAVLLSEQGHDAEALDHARQAVSLDPLSAPMHLTLGLVHYYARRYDEAAHEARRALELTPLQTARQILARALIARGEAAKAVEVLEPPPRPAPSETLALLGAAHWRAGRRDRAEAYAAELRALRPLPTAALARWYALIDDEAAAFDMLERTLPAGPSAIQPLMADPVFDRLRASGRLAALIRRAKLS